MLSFIIWDISPEIFPGLGFVRWYGLCWALGILLGLGFLRRQVEKEKLSIDVDKLVIYLILGILIGARMGHVLFYEPMYYWQNPEALLPFQLSPFEFTGFRGLASHGGVLGVLIALHLYCRKYQQKHLFILDRLVMPAAILAAFIRLGNLINSEIIGTQTDVPWAFVFTSVDNQPRHPSQLYEALFYLLIFGLLWYLKKSETIRLHIGALFGVGLSLIFILRFFIEFLKEDQVAFESTMSLNMGQILSIPLVLTGLFFALRNTKKSVL